MSLAPSPSSPAAPPEGAWQLLGYVRFVLALIVCAGHLEDVYGLGSGIQAGITHGLSGLCGAAAVISFLGISGFCIAHSITTMQEHFVWRRFVRIFPLYLTAIVVSYYWPGMSSANVPLPTSSSLSDFIGQALMLDGIVTHSITGNRVLWTLSLEWWCYMAAPLLIMLPPRRLLGLVGLLSIAHLSWIALGSHLGGFYANGLGGTKLWFLSVFWVLGFWYYLNRSRPHSAVIMIAVVWLLTGLNRDNLSRNYQITLCAGFVSLIIADRVHMPRWLGSLGNVFGNVSYAIYLFHVPLFRWLHETLQWRSPLLILACTILGSWLAHRLIEIPARRMLSRAFRAKAKP
jgi:peptidoglycan/LPS O-acetylase OafA/YrhL